MQYVSTDAEKTQAIAKKLARLAKRAKELSGVIALTGDLGAGKTTFVQGFAEGLGIKDRIISPTFVLMRQHKIPKTQKTLFHIDLYRLDGEKELQQLGLEELLNDTNHLILIEWAEKAKKLLPKNTTWVHFEGVGDSRRISISTDPT